MQGRGQRVLSTLVVQRSLHHTHSEQEWPCRRPRVRKVGIVTRDSVSVSVFRYQYFGISISVSVFHRLFRQLPVDSCYRAEIRCPSRGTNRDFSGFYSRLFAMRIQPGSDAERRLISFFARIRRVKRGERLRGAQIYWFRRKIEARQPRSQMAAGPKSPG